MAHPLPPHTGTHRDRKDAARVARRQDDDAEAAEGITQAEAMADVRRQLNRPR